MATNLSANYTTDSTQLGVLYLLTSVTVMFSNGIVVVVVVKSRELHIPTLWNIAFMALCDFFYGFHYLVLAVPSAFRNQFAYSESLIGPSSCVLTLLYGQNVLNVVVATIDRYISVCRPLKYTHHVTSHRFIMAVIATILLNVCRLCLMILPKPDFYYNFDIALTISKFDTKQSALASVGFPAIAVILILVFIGLIFSDIIRSRRRVIPTAAKPNLFKFSVTFLIAAGVFCLSYLPTSVTILWSAVSGRVNVPKSLVIFATLCTLSNSLWNVIIYTLTYRPFRDASLRLFCKGYYKRKRQIEIRVVYRNESGV